MAFSFTSKELAEMPFPQENKKCPCGCGKQLMGDKEDRQVMMVDGVPQEVNADCYYKGLSDLIDKNPVGLPTKSE